MSLNRQLLKIVDFRENFCEFRLLYSSKKVFGSSLIPDENLRSLKINYLP
jgi:hypothetical protein